MTVVLFCCAPDCANWLKKMLVYHMLNKNSLELLKKGAAKQQRIIWHLRWLVRTRADISLRPSG